MKLEDYKTIFTARKMAPGLLESLQSLVVML